MPPVSLSLDVANRPSEVSLYQRALLAEATFVDEQHAAFAVDHEKAVLGHLLSDGELLFRTGERGVTLVLRRPDHLVRAQLRDGECSVAVAGRLDRPAEVIAALRDRFACRERPGSVDVTMTFFSSTLGVNRTRKRLDVPRWAEIREHYDELAQAPLDRLMRLDTAPAAGRLILLHGPPGTGKSFAVRALAQAWQRWCRTTVVVDPDRLLQIPEYLMEIARLSSGDSWRLVVLEDAGELIGSDARQQADQGLSRLLNLSDGLLGQSTRTLYLITTNEPLAALHPAVRRPGRCAAEIEVPYLGAEHADRLLAASGQAPRATGPMPLAEVLNPPQVPTRPMRRVGFAA